MRQLAREYGKHPIITVYETDRLYGERGRFRVMQFSDDAVQGAIDLNDPSRIVLEYPRAMIHLVEANHPAPHALFLIGHGIGTIAGYFANTRLTVAEIDERVAALSRQYFGYTGNHVAIGDGRLLLGEEEHGSLDCILADAFSDKGTPVHLASAAFFRLAAAKLAVTGTLLLNLMGKVEGDRFVNAVHAGLCEVFPYTAAFALPGEGRSDRQNILLAGSGIPIAFDVGKMAGFAAFRPEPGFPIRERS